MIGEVLIENGKVIVIGCFGVKLSVSGLNLIEEVYLKVFVVIGLYVVGEVM